MLIYIIYFVVLSVLAIEYEVKPFKSIGLLMLVVLAIALLAGLRSQEVARDYQQYQFVFDTIKDFIKDDSGSYFSVFEPGFVGIVLLFRMIFLYNYGVAIMLFFALTSVTAKIYSIYKISINPYLVILLYFAHYFILQEMTQIRIGFASAIFLGSLNFYIKKNYKVFVSMVLLATFFHYSALLYLLLFTFNIKNFNKIFYAAFLAAAIVLGFLKLPLFGFVGDLFSAGGESGKLNTYAEVIQYNLIDEINVFNIITLCSMGCCFYLIYFIPEVHFLRDKYLTLILKLNIFSIFTLCLFSGVPLVAFRISELFGILSIFNFSYLTRYLPFSKYNVWFVVLLAFVFFYTNVFYGHLLMPYEIVPF